MHAISAAGVHACMPVTKIDFVPGQYNMIVCMYSSFCFIVNKAYKNNINYICLQKAISCIVNQLMTADCTQ